MKVLLLPLVLAASASGQTVLNGHPVVLDASGKLNSWVVPQDRAYGDVVQRAFNRLKSMPKQANGLQTYFTHSVFDPDTFAGNACCPHHPAGVYAMFSDSALAYYAFSGDRSVITLVQETLDYMLLHGLSSPTASWASVPFATSNIGDLEYRGFEDSVCGGCSDGTGFLEPDKVGEFGLALIRLYELTGESRYRDAALDCGKALATHVRPGDATHSPWPFRVNALTNAIKEEYTASAVGSIRLLDELVRLKLGDVASFQAARDLAYQWLKTYPMQNERWSGYFEDVAGNPTNFNQYVPMETARYLLDHPERDADLLAQVPKLIAFVERNFAQDTASEKGVQFGANAISEQNVDMTKMGSHTARYASINAAWFLRTGDLAAKEKAFRSFNWASYLCRASGVVGVGVDGKDDYWFSDSYGDYIRHFHWGMAAIPQWAPAGENHLVRASSIVKEIRYGADDLAYTTFEAQGVEVLRVKGPPTRVIAGATALSGQVAQGEGYTLTGDILEVRHDTSGKLLIDFRPLATPDAGVVEPASPKRGCGCSAGPNALGLLVVWVLALRRGPRTSGPAPG